MGIARAEMDVEDILIYTTSTYLSPQHDSEQDNRYTGWTTVANERTEESFEA
jgi:hypothetical protein